MIPNAVTGAHRRLSNGEWEAISDVIECVDRAGRDADELWGCRRLPTLVPIEWAERFRTQCAKFHAACDQWDVAEVRKHGEAMIRAYAKLGELATAAGHKPGPAEQWEFEIPEGLVILVRDRSRLNQVDTGGRQAMVWSLDEIAEVIRKHPILAEVKNLFPGAVLESVRPARDVKAKLNDTVEGLPF